MRLKWNPQRAAWEGVLPLWSDLLCVLLSKSPQRLLAQITCDICVSTVPKASSRIVAGLHVLENKQGDQGPQGKRESIQRPPPDAPSGAPPGGSSVRISGPTRKEPPASGPGQHGGLCSSQDIPREHLGALALFLRRVPLQSQVTCTNPALPLYFSVFIFCSPASEPGWPSHLSKSFTILDKGIVRHGVISILSRWAHAFPYYQR